MNSLTHALRVNRHNFGIYRHCYYYWAQIYLISASNWENSTFIWIIIMEHRANFTWIQISTFRAKSGPASAFASDSVRKRWRIAIALPKAVSTASALSSRSFGCLESSVQLFSQVLCVCVIGLDTALAEWKQCNGAGSEGRIVPSKYAIAIGFK